MLLNTKEETGVKFNPGLSANWPSNNWAQEGTKKFSLLRTQTYFRTLLLSTLKVTFRVERSDDRIRLQRSQAEKSVISDISRPLIRHFSLLQLLQRFRLEYHHEPLDLRQKLLTVPDQPVKIKFVDRRWFSSGHLLRFFVVRVSTQ